MEVAFKVDVDTYVGLSDGVPRLLDLFNKFSLPATFFVSFGPDNSGKAIRRIRQAGFIKKMWRTNPFRLYGLRTLLSGTLFPPRFIPGGNSDLLRSIVQEGHELGIHGFDHVYWQDHIEDLGIEEAESQLHQAVETYQQVLGDPPESSAAPGWRCNGVSLKAQERFDFMYASDVRGGSPFYPMWRGNLYRTLQIPTTLPTMDELLGSERSPVSCLLSALNDGLNVYTLHAEVEGGVHLPLFETFICDLNSWDVRYLRLKDIAERILNRGEKSISYREVRPDFLPGRSGWVSCQA